MSKTYEGDEWKYAKESPPLRTRHQEQAFTDTEFCNGRITIEQWRKKFDELSNLSLWSAEGPVKK